MFNSEHRRPDLLAAPGRADPAGRRGLVATRKLKRTDTDPRLVPRLGRLAADHHGGLQLHGRASSTSTTRSPWPPTSPPLIGMGAALCWEKRAEIWASLTLAAAIDGHGGLGVRPPQPHLRLPALAEVAGPGRRPGRRARPDLRGQARPAAGPRRSSGLSFVAALAGPTAYTLSTLDERAHRLHRHGRSGGREHAGRRPRRRWRRRRLRWRHRRYAGPEQPERQRPEPRAARTASGRHGPAPTGGFGGGQNSQHGSTRATATPEPAGRQARRTER